MCENRNIETLQSIKRICKLSLTLYSATYHSKLKLCNVMCCAFDINIIM